MDPKDLLALGIIDADSNSSIDGRTRLQKLVFLAQEQGESAVPEEFYFYSYIYGPFSKELLDSLEEMEQRGLVEVQKVSISSGDKYIYNLTERGQDMIDQALAGETEVEQNDARNIIWKAKSIEEKFNSMPISRLLDYVYERYPDYTEKSVI